MPRAHGAGTPRFGPAAPVRVDHEAPAARPRLELLGAAVRELLGPHQPREVLPARPGLRRDPRDLLVELDPVISLDLTGPGLIGTFSGTHLWHL